MSPYEIAWIVIVGAAAFGTLGLYVLTRWLPSRPVRLALLVGMPVLLLTPSPVPDHAGAWAPAFIVLLMEGVFQSGGAPGQAARILLFAIAVAIGLVVALLVLTGKGRDAEPTPGTASPD